MRVCYCAALTRIETRSRVVILQHPREHGMPIGTAHMAALCLPNASLNVGLEWDESDVLREACSDPERPAILLYPGGDARDILRDPPTSAVTLVVVDGTWSQAKALVRDNPRLASLPRYAFHAPEPSTYRIRREPQVGYVSTLEALMHVLGAIEGDPERFRELLKPMKAMVDAQVAAEASAVEAGVPPRRRRRKRKKLTPYEQLPASIRERYEDLVLVYSDASAWPRGTAERRFGDELVYWVAHRPSTGENFSFVVAPRNPVAPDVARHTGLSVERLAAGGSVAEMLSAFSTFSRPTDVLTSWGRHALRAFEACGGEFPGAFLDMQQVARRLMKTNPGSLRRYADSRLDRSAPHLVDRPQLPPARAGRRVGLLLDILRSWRAFPPPAAEAPPGSDGSPGAQVKLGGRSRRP